MHIIAARINKLKDKVIKAIELKEIVEEETNRLRIVI